TMRCIPREGYWAMALIARGGGFGLGWHHLNEERDWTNPTIRLLPEQVIHGRLVDLQGQPAEGVRVKVVHVNAVIPKKDALYVGFLAPPDGLRCWPEATFTNKEGRFSLRGVGQLWQATIQVRDQRFAAQTLVLDFGEKGQQQEITQAL